MFIYLIKSVYGPQLYRLFSQDGCARGRYYIPGNMEYYSNSLLTIVFNFLSKKNILSLNFLKFRGLYVFCKWGSPLILAFAYRNNYLSLDSIHLLTKLTCLFGFVVFSTLVIRGLGRIRNPYYLDFIKQYTEINGKTNSDQKKVR